MAITNADIEELEKIWKDRIYEIKHSIQPGDTLGDEMFEDGFVSGMGEALQNLRAKLIPKLRKNKK